MCDMETTECGRVQIGEGKRKILKGCAEKKK